MNAERTPAEGRQSAIMSLRAKRGNPSLFTTENAEHTEGFYPYCLPPTVYGLPSPRPLPLCLVTYPLSLITFRKPFAGNELHRPSPKMYRTPLIPEDFLKLRASSRFLALEKVPDPFNSLSASTCRIAPRCPGADGSR
jgi:hypothetical protein